jgi:transcriptional repressor NrdR
MQCPVCQSETKVLDSRDMETFTRRRRECLKCEKRFTTYERVEVIPLTIIKKDGSRENFDRNKLLKGVLIACQKLPIGREKIDALVESIEQDLRKQDLTEIPSKVIGELVMQKLRELDKVAYIRFASVYREFADIVSFEQELRKLKH